ncbi:MAG: hypothetical protein M1480_14560 [Bacteroidetes bacterium]|nr:hypothetical protein [Bacteroidota bacterium]
MATREPLSSLAPPAIALEPRENVVLQEPVKIPSLMGNLGTALFIFLILVVICWVILVTLKPRFVQNHDHEHSDSDSGNIDCGVSTGKCLVWSIVFAIVIVAIIWMFRAF